MAQTKVLDVETYDSAEAKAIEGFPIRVNQAFFPEMFASVGYPARVTRPDQLWRYIDVMHETRVEYNMDYLLFGLTEREFELFKQVTQLVDKHASESYGRRAHASSALLRAIHVLRLIKVTTGDERPVVLEVGPGCGYLGMLLVLEGYPYVSTDVAQAFYLYQNRMLSLVANEVKDLAAEDGDILSLEAPKPGNAVHIPWWKWVTLKPEQIKWSAGIMTCNHCLCEMHPLSMGYLARVSSQILGNHPGGGQFVFDSWGYDLLHGEQTVLARFSEFGFRLCHNEAGVSGMVLADKAAGWPVYGNVAPPPPALPSGPPPQPPGFIKALNRYPALKKVLRGAVNLTPALRRALIRRIYPAQASQILALEAARAQTTTQVPDFKASNPLSQKLSHGRQAVIANAPIKLPEIEDFLATYFGGAVPVGADEAFLSVIRLKF